MTTTLYPTYRCTLLNARFALNFLSAPCEKDPRTTIVLEKLVQEGIFKDKPTKFLDLEDVSSTSMEDRISISIMDDWDFLQKLDENYKFSSCTVALSFMAHLASDKKILKDFFRDDYRPIVCMEPVEFRSSNGNSEESFIVMGVDCTQEDFPFKVRLVKRSKFMAGLYRPILSAHINKKQFS